MAAAATPFTPPCCCGTRWHERGAAEARMHTAQAADINGRSETHSRRYFNTGSVEALSSAV